MLKFIMAINHTEYNKKSIAVILCTKNGELFIDGQLKSIINQNHKNIDLYISDNSSNDKTVKKINNFIEKNKYNDTGVNIFLLRGDDLHFANNFISLAQHISKEYNYYAFCDQDDIWEPNHILRAIIRLDNNKKSCPSLYCSRTSLINDGGLFIGHSKYFKKDPSFKNALVQSLAGGNTMVFNRQAYKLLLEVNPSKDFIPSHDWLLYLLVSAHKDGFICYEKTPSVQYRQHENNAIGSNTGFLSVAKRANHILQGTWSSWLEANYKILKNCSKISDENMLLLNEFYELRNKNSAFLRIKKFLYLGIYRQTVFGNISMGIALLIKKF